MFIGADLTATEINGGSPMDTEIHQLDQVGLF